MRARAFAGEIQADEKALAKSGDGLVRAVDVALLALGKLGVRHRNDGLLAFLDARFAGVTAQTELAIAVAIAAFTTAPVTCVFTVTRPRGS